MGDANQLNEEQKSRPSNSNYDSGENDGNHENDLSSKTALALKTATKEEDEEAEEVGQQKEKEKENEKSNSINISDSTSNVKQSIDSKEVLGGTKTVNPVGSNSFIEHNPNLIEEGDTSMQEEPNTSVLLPLPPDKTTYNTPSKVLPPLKDQDIITTPKSFHVARDVIADEDDSQNFGAVSSPVSLVNKGVESRNNRKSLIYKEEISKIINSAISRIIPIERATTTTSSSSSTQEVVDSIAETLTNLINSGSQNQQYLESDSSSTIKIELEEVKSKFSAADNDNIRLKEENDMLESKLQSSQQQSKELQHVIEDLQDKIRHSAKSFAELNRKFAESKDTCSQQESHYLSKLEQLTSSNVEQNRKLASLVEELNTREKENFANKLELTKAKSELSFLRNESKWLHEELQSSQQKYSEALKQSGQTQSSTDSAMLNTQSKLKNAEQLIKSHETELLQLNSSLAAETKKNTDLEVRLKKIETQSLLDINAKQELIDLMKIQSRQRESRIKELEEYVNQISKNSDEAFKHLELSVSEKDDEIAVLQEKLQRVEEALAADMAQTLSGENSEQTFASGYGSSSEFDSGSGPGQISLLYSEFIHVKKELTLERMQKEKLEGELEEFVFEMDSLKRALGDFNAQKQYYESVRSDLQDQITILQNEKLELEKSQRHFRAVQKDNDLEVQRLKQTLKDLGRQLCFSLIHTKIRDNHEEPLSLAEKTFIENVIDRTGNDEEFAESDTSKLISERLLEFKDLIELRQRNEELLSAVRELSTRLESGEAAQNSAEIAAIDEAQETILMLQNELESTCNKMSLLVKERDALEKIVRERGSGDAGNDKSNGLSIANFGHNEVENEEKEKIRIKMEKQLEQKQKQIGEEKDEKEREEVDKELSQVILQLREVKDARDKLKVELAAQVRAVEQAEFKVQSLQRTNDRLSSDIEHANQQVNFWNKQFEKLEGQLNEKALLMSGLEAKLNEKETTVKSLCLEKDFALSMQKSLESTIVELRQDKKIMNEQFAVLQSTAETKNSELAKLAQKLDDSESERLAIQRKLNERESKISILTDQRDMSMKSQQVKLEQINDLSSQLLHARKELSQMQAIVSELLPDSASQSVTRQQMEDELKEYGDRISELTNQLKDKNETILETTTKFEKESSSMSEKLKSKETEKVAADGEITRLNGVISSKIQEMENMKKQYTMELDETVAKLKAAESKTKSSQSVEDELKKTIEDLQDQRDISKGLEQKIREYHTQVSTLVQQINAYKSDSDSNQELIQSLQDQLEQVRATRKDEENQILSQKLELQTENAELLKKVEELQGQNTLLLNQLELSSSSNQETNPSGEKSQDIAQIISFLRREKESSDEKLPKLEEENVALKIKLENLQNKVNNFNAGAPSASINLTANNEQQKQIQMQLDQLKSFKESNSVLVNENLKKNQELVSLNSEVTKIKLELEKITQLYNNQLSHLSVEQQRVKLFSDENVRLKQILSANSRTSEQTKSPAPEIAKMQEQMDKLKTKANDRIAVLRRELDSKDGIVKAKEAEIEKIRQELQAANAKEQNKSVNGDSKDVEKKLADVNRELKTVKEESAKLVGEKNELVKQLATLKAQNMKSGSTAGKSVTTPTAATVVGGATTAAGATGAAVKNGEVPKLEAQIRELEQSLEKVQQESQKKLDEEKSKTRLEVEKKFEFKLRLLTRKVEKYEKESLPNKNNTVASALPIANDALLSKDKDEPTTSVAATGGQSNKIMHNNPKQTTGFTFNSVSPNIPSKPLQQQPPQNIPSKPLQPQQQQPQQQQQQQQPQQQQPQQQQPQQQKHSTASITSASPANVPHPNKGTSTQSSLGSAQVSGLLAPTVTQASPSSMVGGQLSNSIPANDKSNAETSSATLDSPVFGSLQAKPAINNQANSLLNVTTRPFGQSVQSTQPTQPIQTPNTVSTSTLPKNTKPQVKTLNIAQSGSPDKAAIPAVTRPKVATIPSRQDKDTQGATKRTSDYERPKVKKTKKE